MGMSNGHNMDYPLFIIILSLIDASTMIEYFISLLILMKSGTSQYSRPTTAKKVLQSPKILKKP